MKAIHGLALLCLLPAGSALATDSPARPAPYLQLKYFEPTGGDGDGQSRGGLGFSYGFDLKLADTEPDVWRSDEKFSQWRLGLKADGNVAFDADLNPADFLKTAFDFLYEYSWVQNYRSDLPADCNPQDPTTMANCPNDLSGDALRLAGGASASLESDQRFDNKAYTYGGVLAVVYNPAPSSPAARLNPFEAPFRLLRQLSGEELGSMPAPNSFPVLRLAYERVDPDQDEARKTAEGRLQAYDRIGAEIGFTTVAGRASGKRVNFDLSWRIFQEIAPSAAVRAADLDRFQYLAAALELDGGWRLTYTTGKLPFDQRNDDVWELGYRFHFE